MTIKVSSESPEIKSIGKRYNPSVAATTRWDRAASTAVRQDGAADNYAVKTVYISKSCDWVQRHPTVRSPEVGGLSMVTNVYKSGLNAILIDNFCIISKVKLFEVPRPNALSVGR
jgi:hypothetical protein